MGNWRRLILVTHRWIGLSTSLVLIIAGATGAMIVWDIQGDFRRVAGRIHENLALGRAGMWIVLIATGGAILLQCGGVILWWKRKTVSVRTGSGWRACVNDLHHVAGALGFVMMLLIAMSGIGMRMVGPGPVRRAIVDLHTARHLPLAIDVVYALASIGFVVQGATGIAMWSRKQAVPHLPSSSSPQLPRSG